MKHRAITLLGPQRFNPMIADVIQHLPSDSRVASVTAGWQEREAEIEELDEHVQRRTANLMLHRRSDEVFDHHPDFHRAYRRRQDYLARLQGLYRIRLRYTLKAVRSLMLHDEDAALIEPEREHALAALRELDEQHLARIREVHVQFKDEVGHVPPPALLQHREEIREILGGCAALLIAGGHVMVLLNRLRLFDIAGAVGDSLPLVAWSAGAMALSQRIVLFHDSPPQGPGYPEVMDAGLGLARGILPLPHASRRLRLHDPTRVSLLARRFIDAKCVALDDFCRVDWNGVDWCGSEQTRLLQPNGGLSRLEAPCL